MGLISISLENGYIGHTKVTYTTEESGLHQQTLA
jgi:hypothetical protein